MKLKGDKFLDVIKEFNNNGYQAAIFVDYNGKIALIRTSYSLTTFFKVIYKDSFVYVSRDVLRSNFKYSDMNNYYKDQFGGYAGVTNYNLK